MIDFITYDGVNYPEFQSHGNASQFAIPFAKHFCSGVGYDIGCCKKEWSFPGSMPIDLEFDDPYCADNLPEENVDYIFQVIAWNMLMIGWPQWITGTPNSRMGEFFSCIFRIMIRNIGALGIIENINIPFQWRL